MEEIRRTEQILSEYLSISKPHLPFQQRIELTAQINSVVELMTSYANMSNVTLSTDSPPSHLYITGSPAELKQLLVNFIKNAIEACRDVDNGMVNITVYEDAEQVAVEIKDNGVGMTPEQLSRLGSIYYSTKMSGTGIGLTFSYQAIRAMNGSVSVRSSPRSGTVFLITLPHANLNP